MECILFGWRKKKKKITRSRPIFSLCKKRKSNSRCNRELAAGDLMRVQKTRRAGKAIRQKLKERSPFFCWQGVSIYRRGPPSYESRQLSCESFSRGLLR